LTETDRTDRTEKLFSETKKEPELKQYKTEDTVSTETVETVEEKQPEKHDTREEIAKELGWSFGKVAQAEYVKKNNPDNWEKAKSGDYSINKAYEETKKVEKKKEKKEELIQKKKEYEERINDDVFEEKEYRIIYADPPWKYNDKQDTPNLGGANKHYDTMSIPELCDMKISEITEKDAVLFLWTTSPFLEDSFKIINSWGFKYKSSFVWDKVMHNMGHYNSVRHEFLLIATKGSCTPDEKKLFDSVQSIEKTRKHSEKPEKFREIIDTLYVYGNRIELFARKKHDHWDVYGNEVADEQ
jgi:N6-adenosine-specific RNA methylase IME4